MPRCGEGIVWRESSGVFPAAERLPVGDVKVGGEVLPGPRDCLILRCQLEGEHAGLHVYSGRYLPVLVGADRDAVSVHENTVFAITWRTFQ